jgi:hypothetical protein
MTASYRICGRTIAVEFGADAAGRALAAELASYPRTEGAPDLTVVCGPVPTAERGLRNPACHHELPDGFVATMGATTVRFSFDAGGDVRTVYFEPHPLRHRHQRGHARFFSTPFETPQENAGQIFHELVLVPALFLRREFAPVHAAGFVAPAGGAILVGGTGGVGKSSLALELCRRRGFAFLADDIALVSSDGRAWPNLAYPKVYAYNVIGNAELRRTILTDRSAVDRLHWRYRTMRAPGTVSRRVAPARLYDRVAADGAPVSAYWMLAREVGGSLEVQELSAVRAADMAVAVLEAEYGVFTRHLRWHEFNSAAGQKRPRVSLAAVTSRWRALLADCLEAVPCRVIRVPAAMPHAEFCAQVGAIIGSDG